VKIESVELRRVALPLITPFRTSFGTEAARDVLLVHVMGPDSEGWGECVAMSEPLYSSEYTEGAHAVVREHLLPRLASYSASPEAEAVSDVLSPVKGHPMAKSAVEMAILDGDLSQSGTSLASYLGAVRDSVAAGVSVGIMGSLAELLDAVDSYISQGYVRVKIKIEPGWDIEPVRAVRERFPDVPLQVDANAAYSLADAAHLAELDRFDLLLIEQPLAEDDIAGHAELAAGLATPVCLDESITSAAIAADAISRGACAIVNIKAGRVGGYLEARRVHDVCAARNVPVWCGGMLETGIGRAANVALAALPNFTLPGDTSASDRYWQRDLTEPFVLSGGRLAVPDRPGIGVRPDPDYLADVTTSREEIGWTAIT
jgi:o-succinylbenzoate synthase